MVAMPKFIGDGFYMCTMRVEYEWKPIKCLSCKVVGHVPDGCPRKIASDVVKNLKNPTQPTRGVPIGIQFGFKSTKQIYKPVSNKNGISTSGKKRKGDFSVVGF
ncbi:zinc knuckle CX2CX4HX4C containing protein [Tanacetum coccineum]|uniref:Zinc knuckle CX2CX4HX4C containing protein n=1 Tax=Tanacetum coccineum TaxID=301880 RepID=A0ABQ5DTH8_9ASTR